MRRYNKKVNEMKMNLKHLLVGVLVASSAMMPSAKADSARIDVKLVVPYYCSINGSAIDHEFTAFAGDKKVEGTIGSFDVEQNGNTRWYWNGVSTQAPTGDSVKGNSSLTATFSGENGSAEIKANGGGNGHKNINGVYVGTATIEAKIESENGMFLHGNSDYVLESTLMCIAK